MRSYVCIYYEKLRSIVVDGHISFHTLDICDVVSVVLP